MDAILEQFLMEARDNLEYLDKHLENIKDSDDETINALFRAAHTLKGGAGLVGFVAVKEVTHAAEDLLDAYRNKKIEFNEEMIEILYDAFDEVIELIDAAEELGSIDVNVDEKRIEDLKNQIRAFISQDNNDKKDEISTILEIDNQITTEMFSATQIQNIVKDLPLTTPEISREFLDNDNWYLMSLDLDIETLKFGNDPIYLFYLLDTEKFEVSITTDCEALKDDNLEWHSVMMAMVKTTEERLNDAFLNIIDDIGFRLLSIESLFENDFDNIENEMFDDFKDELVEIILNKEYEKLDEKLSAITQILNLETNEGFILIRLQMVLNSFEIGSEKYLSILDLALQKLNIKIENRIEEKQIDEEDKKWIVTILNAQLDVLKFAKDKNLFDRTKNVVQNIADSLGENVSFNNLEELKDSIRYLLDSLGESIKHLDVELENTKEIKKVEQPTQKVHQTNKEEHKKTATPKVVKIDQIQIDELMDIVGELLVVKNALPYIAENLVPENIDESKRELSTKYEEISRIIEQLRDRVMQMRLLPLEYIFGRYPKLVRDISKKLNKKIKYIEEGGETKLDKMVIEKLADPLVHIIRNSLDHGIESPSEREAKNKPPQGILKISAISQGDKVFITIKDDGRGIDIDKVVSKALEKRLISPDLLDSMGEEEKLKLIFLPGLSTNEEITELSGRGVGTDAFKKTIEELGGKIYIKSLKDSGTEIKMELPLSVALTNVFHIEMNKINYAIPMDYIVETVKVTKDEVQTANHNPFIKIRGELIPLLIEGELLGDTGLKDENSIVIIKFNDIKVGFVVDEFVGQLDVVQKPLTGVIGYHPFISGVSLLGNGDILFVLDVTKILKDSDD
jgi:two-component system chemotaxis sensor kinase CheA